MKPPETNDPLDALLQESDAYVEDKGFTARVMTALPRRRRSRLRPAILIGSAVIGFALIAWWLPPIKNVFVTDPNGKVAMQLTLGTIVTAGVLVLAVGSLVWGVLAAVRWED